ncbi:hypothetical protein GLV89_13680 [Halomonas alkaliantarctica]|nr:hypothetical protein [Halomonas alkaliantarctica]
MSFREVSQAERLAFLARVAKKEANYLELTSTRVFGGVAHVTRRLVAEWVDDIDAAERLDALEAGRAFTQPLIEMALRMAGEADNRLHEPHSSPS